MRRRFPQAYITLAADTLGVLSHETRLTLVLALTQGPASVTELCDYLELSQSNVSHHLAILRAASLVADTREGQFVFYNLDVPTWRLLGDGFFDQLLGGGDEVRLQNIIIRRSGPPPARRARTSRNAS